MFPLLDLPTEIILPIVEAVSDRNDLIALAQTCKTLRDAAEAKLWDTIVVHDGAKTRALTTLLNARPARFAYVQKLAVTPDLSDWDCVQAMPRLVRQMNNLRWLQVENPLINTFQYGGSDWEERCVEEYMQCFRDEGDEERALRNLRSFTFHWRGLKSRYYKVGIVTPIFSSRFLKHIHVSCVDFDELHIPTADVGKAAIESLHLDECNINATALCALLGLPRNLKILIIDENLYHRDERHARCPPLNTQLDIYMEALSRQQHSLERLRHVCRKEEKPNSSMLHLRESAKSGFSNFNALKTLEVAKVSSLYGYLMVPGLAPPSLETLILTNFNWWNAELWDKLEEEFLTIASSVSVPRLELHMEPGSRLPQLVPTMLTHTISSTAPRRERLIHLARVLKEINLPVTAIAHRKASHIVPPYLYADRRGGASQPKILFDSQSFWEKEAKYQKLVAEGHKGVFTAEDDGTTIAAKIVTGYVMPLSPHDMQGFMWDELDD